MDQIRIVADSSCNILALDGVEFVSVPLTIRTDTEEFRDDAALDVNEMVMVLRNTKGRSYSACPNITDWEEAFGDSGDVLAFTITSSLSGSYNAACIARDACQERDPSAVSMWWIRCPPGRRSVCSSKGRCPRCAPARTLARCAGR